MRTLLRRFGVSRPQSPPIDLRAALDAPGAVLLDARTTSEYAGAHAVGAQHISTLSSKFDAAVADLDPAATHYVYGSSGNRSRRVVQALRERGLTAHLIGTLDDLIAAGIPLTR